MNLFVIKMSFVFLLIYPLFYKGKCALHSVYFKIIYVKSSEIKGVGFVATLVRTKPAPKPPPPKHTRNSDNIARDMILTIHTKVYAYVLNVSTYCPSVAS